MKRVKMPKEVRNEPFRTSFGYKLKSRFLHRDFSKSKDISQSML